MSVSTDLTAEVLAKASQALLVEAQQGEDFEEPLHLREVHRCDGFVQLLGDDDLQFLLRLLQHQQTGVHGALCDRQEGLAGLQHKEPR